MRTKAVIAIAFSFAAPLSAQRTRNIVVVPGQMTQVVTDTMGTPYDVPFAPGRTYRAVLEAFKELKLSADVQALTRCLDAVADALAG